LHLIEVKTVNVGLVTPHSKIYSLPIKPVKPFELLSQAEHSLLDDVKYPLLHEIELADDVKLVVAYVVVILQLEYLLALSA